MSEVDDDSDTEGRPLGRRAFFVMVGAGLSSLAWGGSALDLASKSTLVLPEPLRAAIPVGQGWRIYSVNRPYPRFDPARWRLRIDGLVERPQTLTYAELLALPQVEQTSDFHCVTGWSVEDVRWRGVRFADLLAAAAPLPTARALAFVSASTRTSTRSRSTRRCRRTRCSRTTMDGRPLTRAHGAPARVVMPAMYGYKGVKWLERIVVDRSRRGRATGSSAATTATHGSGGPMASERAARRALRAHRARAALGACERVPRDAGDRARALPAAARRGCCPTGRWSRRCTSSPRSRG